MNGRIHNVNVVTEQAVIKEGALWLRNGRIERVLSAADATGSDEEPHRDAGEIASEGNGSSQAPFVLDGNGGWLLPGYIDVHVHGGFGSDFMDATAVAFEAIAGFHARHGTTGMLATTVTAPPDALDRVIGAVEAYRASAAEHPGARLLGVHLEGPFISPLWPGAQNPAFIVPPQAQWLADWTARYPEQIRMLTLAPETEGALELIERISRQGIVAAAGHTNASYADMLRAAECGLRHAVHTFNAMKGLHHREPGTVGAVLTQERISAEIIADGHHVHPAAIELLVRMKTRHNLLLITDAIAAAGLGDGRYELGGLGVLVRDGVATLEHGDSLAGSTLTMDRALRFLVERIGLDVPSASRLASGNPARLLGIDDRTGRIAPGLQADLVLLDPQLNVRQVWVEGQPVLHG